MFVEGQEILEKRYKVIKRLGGGAFGEIYRGKYSLKHTRICHYIHMKADETLYYS